MFAETLLFGLSQNIIYSFQCEYLMIPLSAVLGNRSGNALFQLIRAILHPPSVDETAAWGRHFTGSRWNVLVACDSFSVGHN